MGAGASTSGSALPCTAVATTQPLTCTTRVDSAVDSIGDDVVVASHGDGVSGTHSAGTGDLQHRAHSDCSDDETDTCESQYFTAPVATVRAMTGDGSDITKQRDTQDDMTDFTDLTDMDSASDDDAAIASMEAEHGLTAGDHIYVTRLDGTYEHHGVYIGDNTVVHYTGPHLPKGRLALIRTTTLKKFMGSTSDRVDVRRYSDGMHDSADIVIRRALKLVGAAQYNLLWNNCEHFATFCKTGKSASLQIQEMFQRRVSATATEATDILLGTRVAHTHDHTGANTDASTISAHQAQAPFLHKPPSLSDRVSILVKEVWSESVKQAWEGVKSMQHQSEQYMHDAMHSVATLYDKYAVTHDGQLSQPHSHASSSVVRPPTTLTPSDSTHHYTGDEQQLAGTGSGSEGSFVEYTVVDASDNPSRVSVTAMTVPNPTPSHVDTRTAPPRYPCQSEPTIPPPPPPSIHRIGDGNGDTAGGASNRV
eukprot:GFYU01002647.1.p1 GENE.GFYU01002647.1~~GFYU01002647.1.p1  ORF type:complete len:479 (-),score=97.27 GFYU01002647.1:475-1911(-)